MSITAANHVAGTVGIGHADARIRAKSVRAIRANIANAKGIMMINLDEINARVAKDKEVRVEDLKTSEITQIRVDRKRLLHEVEGLRQLTAAQNDEIEELAMDKEGLSQINAHRADEIAARDARIVELERERDAAVGDFMNASRFDRCYICKYSGKHRVCEDRGYSHGPADCFEWRGPQENGDADK